MARTMYMLLKKTLQCSRYFYFSTFLFIVCLSAVGKTDAASTNTSPVRVALFNIRNFGITKMSRPSVADIIVKILDRYDMVFIMETRDAKMTSLVKLRQELGETEWDFVASKPVGRQSYKEQYVYFYRPKVMTLVGTHLYEDPRDEFDREPYMAEFRYTSLFAGSEVNVTFLGAHLAPGRVVYEMEALPAAVSSAQQRFPNSNAYITMGDFNADCDYLSCAERDQMTLFSTPELYTSLVPNKVDTTMSPNTDCAYDRVVVTVHDRPKVKVTNVKAYDFQADLDLSFPDAWGVSDHYPVEFALE